MFNKMILQGRLTADPELKTTTSGVSVCEFTVAWSEKYKEIETKCFLRCKAWRGTADFLCKYFVKGQEIIVDGKMQTEEWEKDGEKKSRTILSVDQIHFCGSKNSNSGQTDNSKSNITATFDDYQPNDNDEGLPF